MNVYLPSLVGKGYKDFWYFKGRYRVCKGSRASKKSKTTALNLIFRLMQYENSNLLVVRKTFATLKDSCFSELIWAINSLKVSHLWDIKLSPLEIIYIPTGQKIFFRGLDDPLKITSLTVTSGSLCWLWVEEAYEITSQEDFEILQESIRGKVDNNLFKQITITFNPWNENHWLKKRFFDTKSEDILAITTNYTINEWLDDADTKMFIEMKKQNPRRYQVAGLGHWGIANGLVYENFDICDFDLYEIKQRHNIKSMFGLDFGYTNDPTALFCSLVDISKKEIYVFDELYEKALTNIMIFNVISKMGYRKELIFADSSEPKSIDELREFGLINIRPAKKGRGSINNSIQFLQNFKIIIHSSCKNFIKEISSYTWSKDKLGNPINQPIDDFNHLLDAMRYSIQALSNHDTFSFY